MRPCNQCRQPVENSVLICDECNAWNESHPDDVDEGPSDRHAEHSHEDFYADHSYAILMGAFSLIITALFGMIGLAVYGLNGFIIGGTFGIIIGVVMFTVMVRM